MRDALTGAVLAGGKSRRFGRNKALEVFHGKRLIDHSIQTLRGFCDPVLVVANDLKPYWDVRASLVRDILPHEGPLGGIYTALLFSPHPWVFLRATDMPFLVPELLRHMLKMTAKADVVVPLFGERYEPLLALYNRRCLPAIAQELHKGERKIVTFYGRVKVTTLSEAQWRTLDAEGRSFRNVNTPDDLEALPWS